MADATPVSYEGTRRDGYELLLDDSNGRGRVVVLALSAGKAWTYCWPLANRGTRGGGGLREWLAGCDISYVAGKLDADDWFDRAHVVEHVREDLHTLVRDGVIEQERADEAIEALQDVSDDVSWSRWGEEHDGILPDWWETRTRGIDPEFRRAFAAVWPGGDR